MSGEMNLILKLSDEELRQALGKTIFGDPKTGDDLKNYSAEFEHYTKIIVGAVNKNGDKSQAVILYRNTESKDKSIDGIFISDKKSVIVVAEKGFTVNVANYFHSMSKPEGVKYCNLSSFVYSRSPETVKLLLLGGKEFNDDDGFGDKDLTIDYNPDAPLKTSKKGAYQELNFTRNEALPKLPSTLKFGYSGENNFFAIGLTWEGSYAAVARKVEISCIPARNVVMNMAEKK